MIRLAKEGWREMAVATIVLGAIVGGCALFFWPAAIPFVVLWLWVLSFFRDPPRRRTYAAGDLCAPADGTITEISELSSYDAIGGPAIRIGMFLSLFNVHVNRSPCSGRITRATHKPGLFLDARHPESGRRNESNTLLIETHEAMPGPVEVRQIAGLVARRIICHVGVDDTLTIGSRFGIIKFGSRTELIIPRVAGTDIRVGVGDRVRGGLTIVATQPVASRPSEANAVQTGVSRTPSEVT